MYYKVSIETRNQYELIMSEFTQELLPPDYQEFLDKTDETYYPELSDFNVAPF